MSDDAHLEVVIWCDSEAPGHRRKGTVVASFWSRGDGRWHQQFKGRHHRTWAASDANGVPDLGTTLMANDKPAAGVNLDRTAYVGSRAVYELVCPNCSPERTPLGREWGTGRGKTLQLTEQLLFETLDGIAQVGMSRVTLAQLRDIVQNMASS